MTNKILDSSLEMVDGNAISDTPSLSSAERESLESSSKNHIENENFLKDVLAKKTQTPLSDRDSYRSFLDENYKTESLFKNFPPLEVPSFEERISDKKVLHLSEGNYIVGWKLVETLSARVIDFYNEVVLLECLVDKENKEYEEREFKVMLFEGFALEIGKLFKLCYYERINQAMLEIKDNPNLVLESDFPENNFTKKYGNKVFKKRK